MRKSKFTESQIVATLKQVEGGRQVKDMCRELGISEATYYTCFASVRIVSASAAAVSARSRRIIRIPSEPDS